MAVYEANTRSLAEFISDTKLGFMPCNVESTTGYRIMDNSNYPVSAHEIRCDKIYVVNDCFIDIKGNIVVTSYVPTINYFLITNELPGSHHLSFGYKVSSQALRYEIKKDIELKTYDDFENCMENLIRYIGHNIEGMINEFKRNKDNLWCIDNVWCNIKWQVDKIKK